MDLTHIFANPAPTAAQLDEAIHYLSELARKTVAEIDRLDLSLFAEILEPVSTDPEERMAWIADVRRQNGKLRRAHADIQHAAASLAARRAQLNEGATA